MPIGSTGCYYQDGASSFSPLAQTCIAVLLYLTALVTLIGNVIVLFLHCSGGSPPIKHRTIGKYLVNLSLLNVIAVISTPFDYSNMILGQWWAESVKMCIWYQYGKLVVMFVSSTLLGIVGFERFLFTISPNFWLTKCLNNRTLTLITLTWIGGIISAMFPMGHIGLDRFTDDHSTYYYVCVNNFAMNHETAVQIHSTLFVVSYLIPLFLMVLLFVTRRISTRENNDNKEMTLIQTPKVNGLGYSQSFVLEESKALTTSIILMMLLYILCLTPIKFLQLFNAFGLVTKCSEAGHYRLVYGHFLCQWLAKTVGLIIPFGYLVIWGKNVTRKEFTKVNNTQLSDSNNNF